MASFAGRHDQAVFVFVDRHDIEPCSQTDHQPRSVTPRCTFAQRFQRSSRQVIQSKPLSLQVVDNIHRRGSCYPRDDVPVDLPIQVGHMRDAVDNQSSGPCACPGQRSRLCFGQIGFDHGLETPAVGIFVALCGPFDQTILIRQSDAGVGASDIGNKEEAA